MQFVGIAVPSEEMKFVWFQNEISGSTTLYHLGMVIMGMGGEVGEKSLDLGIFVCGNNYSGRLWALIFQHSIALC